MSWSSIIGHADVIARLRAAIQAGRVHPALLFEGPDGVGKKLVALTLARALLCPVAPSRQGDPCGACATCRAITASADPETTANNQSCCAGIRVVTPSRPDEREARFGGTSSRGEIRSQITVPQIRAVLYEALARDSTAGPHILIVEPAERLGESAANALLKTLEEPPPGEHFVLLTSKPSALLPTVRSRLCRFRFGLLAADDIRRALGRAAEGGQSAGRRSQPAALSPQDLDLISALAGGRVGRALQLAAGPALQAFRETRGLLLDILEAFARGLPGGTFAVLAGASFRAKEREDWLEQIGVLELLLRDLTVLSADPAARALNADIEARLLPLAQALGHPAARALGVLESVRSDLRINVNARLAAERIFVAMALP